MRVVLAGCLDLAGVWSVRLDPDDVGLARSWFLETYADPVMLPGSLDANGIGVVNGEIGDLSGLSRKVRYVGPAWYARTVQIPPEWAGRPLILHLERVHWFTDVWVDGSYLGRQDSLSTPHRYKIAASGRTSVCLVVRVDNTPHIPIGRIGHALTDWTQTNWNGVIGRVSIEPDEATLQSVRVTPGHDWIRITGVARVSGQIVITIDTRSPQPIAWVAAVEGQPFTFDISVQDVEPWSERNPKLLELTLELEGYRHRVRTGRISIQCSGKQILSNGSPIFLRGTLECCVFPQTGYPPMAVPAWAALMAKVKEFGLNHLRFHSWCPPSAAFDAADEAGVLLQVELPVWTGLWSISSEPNLMEYCRKEAHRILRHYGHHPSFGLFALGNEIAFYGEEPEVDALLEELKSCYPGKLFTFSSHGTHLSPACDYYVQADNGKAGEENRPLRGSTWFGVGSRFDREAPNTLVTCNEASDQFHCPVISHEVAEWAVFPDVHNAARYDGVLAAKNFDAIADMLAKRGMLGQSKDFVQASGKLSCMLYKEEIETLLRTRGVAGYQLLGLSDFPGQGTATVGMLDAFWHEKGFVDAAEFRQFCADVVPLLLVPKVIWHAQEVFRGEVKLFHSGEPNGAALHWQVLGNRKEVLLEGSLRPCSRDSACLTSFGELSFSLTGFSTPGHYRLQLSGGEGISNGWSFWVFPSSIPNDPIGDVFVAEFYRQDVRNAIREGRKIWLRLRPQALWSGVSGRFAPAFWSPIHFKEQVGTMGTLIDCDHPIFREFPTESHTGWQWWDVLTQSKALVLNDLPIGFRPILQIIERYDRNDKLGTILEARIGSARLLVTIIDFDKTEGRAATRQLESSIRRYLASPDFEPEQLLTLGDLDLAFRREP